MIIWQADFYKHLSQTNENDTTWNLIICDQNSSIIHEASCQQSEANSNWLIAELESLVKQYSPDVVKVFRPQCLSLFQLLGKALGIYIEATRRTPQLKQIPISRIGSCSAQSIHNMTTRQWKHRPSPLF